MRIEKLVIRNFRSYYGEKVFSFGEGLNLILGTNGDGKTTFFEALNWVLTYREDTKERLPQNESLVSAKYFSELSVGKKGDVSVMLDVVNNENLRRRIVRSFIIEKGENGRMSISFPSHKAYAVSGTRTVELNVDIASFFEKENIMPAMAKKYCVFKGEDDLNIFDDISNLQNLIDLYSDIKDMQPFKDFMDYALEKYAGVVDSFNKTNRTKSAKQASLQNDMDRIRRLIEEKNGQLSTTQDRHDDLTGSLASITEDIELLEKVDKMRKEITKLSKEHEAKTGSLRENYTIELLDSYWIMLGMAPIVSEYREKMAGLVEQRHELELEHVREQTKKAVKEEVKAEAIEEVKKELEVLPLSKNETSMLRTMIDNHRCSVCGTDAPEGSAAYEFMKNRLQRALDQLAAIRMPQPKPAPEPKVEIEPLYVQDNIDFLVDLGYDRKRGTKYESVKIDQLESKIEEKYLANQRLHDEIDILKAQIEELDLKVAQTLSQKTSTEDLTESLNNIDNIRHWYAEKERCAVDIEKLKSVVIPKLEADLEEKKTQYQKLVDKAKGSECLEIYDFLERLRQAVINTEKQTYKEFLDGIASRANEYLNWLNVDDFTGVIRIKLKERNGKEVLSISLEDNKDRIITNPNTSLATTMHISLLFAISSIAKECEKGEYPLLFDAPTSSFDQGKDRSFYQCLSTHVDKQCIVVTKSFLTKNEETGEFEEDREALSSLHCPVYRIKKLSGFDKQDISTIDTQVERLVIG